MSGWLLQGRRLFWSLAAGLGLMLLLTLRRLPPVVASHFDGGGAPNGWSSRFAYALLLLLVGALLPLAIIWLVHTLTQRGPQLLNVPFKDYWRRPEHGPEAVRRVRIYMWWLASIMTGGGLAIHLLVLQANALHPPHLATGGIATLLISLFLAIGVWMAGWFRLLRPPQPDYTRNHR